MTLSSLRLANARFAPILLILFASTLTAQADRRKQPANALQTGKVTVIGPATCLPGAPKGASCQAIKVACPGIPSLPATLATTNPVGTAKGTIILLSGSGGTTFLNNGFANAYVGDGYQVVQLGWNSDWEDTGGVGLLSASCRPATVFKFVFNGAHMGNRTTGFCAQGSSGGGGQIAYSLADYGLADYFDYVVLAAGPGVSKMDYGCDPPLYTGGPLNLCPLLTNAPYAYSGGDKVNRWENTTTCATGNASQKDILKWADDSIVAPNATFSYPKTDMSWFFCVTPPVNSSTGGGKFLIDQVLPKNTPDVNCYSGVCQGEAVWQDQAAFDLTHSEMLTKCMPNHQ